MNLIKDNLGFQIFISLVNYMFLILLIQVYNFLKRKSHIYFKFFD